MHNHDEPVPVVIVGRGYRPPTADARRVERWIARVMIAVYAFGQLTGLPFD